MTYAPWMRKIRHKGTRVFSKSHYLFFVRISQTLNVIFPIKYPICQNTLNCEHSSGWWIAMDENILALSTNKDWLWIGKCLTNKKRWLYFDVYWTDPYLNIMFSWDLVDTCYNLHYNFSHKMGKAWLYKTMLHALEIVCR